MNQPETAPAGGAEILEVILATGGALIATLALVGLGYAHRAGRTQLLARLAEFAARDTGLARWAALPAVLAAGSLITAAFGMYWDISLHIDDGRDAGPLANPAHYFILIGLFGIFAAGFLAIVLPDEKPSPRAVRIAEGWYAPLGGIALLAAAAFALLGFPLDDVWHRIFGQDVTLWGPTHLMLIGGAALTLIGTSILTVEGRVGGERRNWRTVLAHGRRTFAFGGLLIGLSTFQAEFDFGVPQFNLVLEPVMLAFAAGIALVGARLWIGRGAALGAVLFFIAIRGALALLVGPGLGETVPHFPLYIAEALSVEALALAAPRLMTTRPYAFGALSGLAIATLGFAAEYAWSHVWMPVPWPEGLIGDAIVPVLVTGVAAGIVGAFVALALMRAEDGAREAPARRLSPLPAAAGLAAIAAVVAFNVGDTVEDEVRATITLEETSPAPAREAEARVEIDPASVADDAHWVSAIGWQGGEQLHLDHLEEVGPGAYETSEPIPLSGTWKSLIRLHSGDQLLGVPLYLPEDRAIPAEAVSSPEGTFERSFVDETEILQRELKDGVPGYLAVLAYAAVGSIVLAIIVLLGWILVRLGDVGQEPRASERPAKPRRSAAAGAPGAPA